MTEAWKNELVKLKEEEGANEADWGLQLLCFPPSSQG